MAPRRTRSWLVATVVTLVGTGLPPAQAAPVSQGGQPVTLLSGDRVELGRGLPRVTPGPGRAGTGFRSWTEHGRTFVLPADAAEPVARGVLDLGLFDVTGLVASGYDRRPLSVIVGYAAGQRSAAAATVAAAGQRTRSLPSIDADVLSPTAEDPAALWRALVPTGRQRAATGVRKVWLNGLARPLLAESAPQVGAPTAWKAGLTGRGVTVAVLDTGMKLDHPDLKDRIAESRDFTGTRPDGGDVSGHGTHVGSTVAGTGAASQGRYRGIAPEARLLNAKVCVTSCPLDAIIAGMEWAAPRARIVSASIGGVERGYGTDPATEAVQALTARTGALFVASAGNQGTDSSISKIAAADAAVAVASVTKSDVMSDFSSRGPRVDYAVKPDLAAPGHGIVAARASGPTGDNDPVDENYTRMSGTSMATPHVSGAAAILAQAHPDWKAPQLKTALMSSARTLDGISPFAQGAGRLDIARALDQPLTANPGSLGLLARWPHTRPIQRRLELRNTGRTPLKVALTATVTGPDGRPAAKAVSVASELTVPANTTASTPVTFDPRGLPLGQYAGYLTAVAGAYRVPVPVGLQVEPESHDLALRTVGSDGRPLPYQVVQLVDAAGDRTVTVMTGGDATVTAHLPKGRYQPFAALAERQGDQVRTVLTAAEVVTLDQPRSATLSGTGATPVTVSTDRGEHTRSSAQLVFRSVVAGRGQQSAVAVSGPLERLLVTHRSGTDPALALHAQVELVARTEADAFPAWVDHLTASVAGPDFAAPPLRDTAETTVPLTVRASGPRQRPDGFRVTTELAPAVHEGLPSLHGTAYPMAWPGERSDRITPGGWRPTLSVLDPAGSGIYQGANRLVSIAAGRPARLDLLPAVYGPNGLHSIRGKDDWLWAKPDLCTGPTHIGEGDSFRCAAKVVLYRNGQEISTGDGEVKLYAPPEASDYRLVAEATSGLDWLGLSTRVRADWTFRSGRTGQDVLLPLLTVRYAPALDRWNAAPAGRAFAIPLTVEYGDDEAPWHQPTPSPKVAKLGVEVSYDDGRTWHPARLTATAGNRWIARVVHPAGNGSVSLRAVAKAASGDAVTQTVIRAYELR